MSDDRERRNGEPELEWSAAGAGEGLVGGGEVDGSSGIGTEACPAPRVPARRAWAWGAFALAACLAAFFAGISISDRGAGRGSAEPGTVGPPSDERWLLLLYEDAAYQAPATDEERAGRVAEYAAWANDLAERGIVVEGEELAGPVESEMLDGRRDRIETGPGAPSGPVGTVSGYFVIEAPDQAAAVAIARTTPHLAHGGTVVVRRIVRH